MTANEKAATFIGWYAGLPIPDMSKPDNYMRAFETVDSKSYRALSLDDGGSWGCELWVSFHRNVYEEGATPAEAVINALVAFYDAKHVEEEVDAGTDHKSNVR